MSQTCPYCKLSIPSGATVCGHCGAEKETVVIDISSESYDGDIVLKVIGAIMFAVVGGYIGWSDSKNITGLLLGAFIGGCLSLWFPLIVKLIKGVFGLAIGGLVGLVVAAITGIQVYPIIICAVLGFIIGYLYQDKEDRWHR